VRAIVIFGWPAIAKAAGKAIGRSVSIRTAQRYARPGRPNRLPVFKYENGVVYLKRGALALWRDAFAMPLGGREPGLGDSVPNPSTSPSVGQEGE
jgi:hypothetical protein